VSGGNDFGYFCANDSAVIEANVALTFSRGMGGGKFSPLPQPAGAHCRMQQNRRRRQVEVCLDEETFK